MKDLSGDLHERSKTKQKRGSKPRATTPAPKNILCLDGENSSCIQSSNLEKLSCEINPNSSVLLQLTLCVWYFLTKHRFGALTSGVLHATMRLMLPSVPLQAGLTRALASSYATRQLGLLLTIMSSAWLCWITSLWLLVWAVGTT